MFLQFVALLFPVWVMGWVPWRAIDLADGPDGGLMQLTMVSVTSLLVFVVLWYVVMTFGGGFLDGHSLEHHADVSRPDRIARGVGRHDHSGGPMARVSVVMSVYNGERFLARSR